MPLLIIVIGAIFVFGGGVMASEIVATNKEEWTKFDKLFKLYANMLGLDWHMLKAIALNESDLGRDSRVKAGKTSSDGLSWGLMQLTLVTANDFEKATPEKLNDAEFSIRVSAKFLASLKKQFQNNERDMVMAYNQGAGNQKKFIKAEENKTLLDSQYPQAREYYKRYLRNYSKVKVEV